MEIRAWPRLSLFHKGLVIVFLPLAFELSFVFLLSHQLQQAENEIKQEARAKEILATTSELVKSTFELAFIASMALDSGRTSQAIADKFDRTYQKIVPVRGHVQDLVSNNIDDQAAFKPVSQLFDVALPEIGGVNDYLHGKRDAGTLKLVQEYRDNRDQLAVAMQTLVGKFVARFQQIQENAPEKQRESREKQRQILNAGLILNVVMAFGLAVFFSRGITRRLGVLADNTKRLGAGRELSAPLPGSDEIASLDKVFHEMATALAEAAEQKQEIMSMVTHDLRTPLTAIYGALALILRSPEDIGLQESVLKRLKIMERNVQRLINMINDLLDYDKLEAGALSLDLAQSKMSDVIERSVQSVEGVAQESKVEIVTHCPADGLEANVDGDRIVQVLVNLISNAVKFSPPEGKVTVSVESQNGNVCFRVADEGRGIPPEAVSTIFERYKQVKSSDGRRGKGTGLGLPICKLLVEAHNGTIGVESKEGAGSTFWFLIPRT